MNATLTEARDKTAKMTCDYKPQRLILLMNLKNTFVQKNRIQNNSINIREMPSMRLFSIILIIAALIAAIAKEQMNHCTMMLFRFLWMQTR